MQVQKDNTHFFSVLNVFFLNIEITLGSWFSLAVKVATIISCLGSCTGYIIFFGMITLLCIFSGSS